MATGRFAADTDTAAGRFAVARTGCGTDRLAVGAGFGAGRFAATGLALLADGRAGRAATGRWIFLVRAGIDHLFVVGLRPRRRGRVSFKS